MDTCISHFDGKVSLFPVEVIMELVGALSCLLGRLVVLYYEWQDPTSTHRNKVDYGIGAIAIIKFLCLIGFAVTIPKITLFYVLVTSPGDDARNFACQVSDSYSAIFPLIIAYFVLLLLAFSSFRNKAAQRLPLVISEYLDNPCAAFNKQQQPSHVRIASFPSGRGLWVPPLHREMKRIIIKQQQQQQQLEHDQEAKQGDIEVLGIDAFYTPLNPESPEWFLANMNKEGIANAKSLFTDFLSLDLPDNSIDVLITPIGSTSPFFSMASNQDEAIRKERLTAFVKLVHRVLKPNGLFISTNLTSLHDEWMQKIDAVFEHFNVCEEKVCWSWQSAKITVARKSSQEENEEARREEEGRHTEGDDDDEDQVVAGIGKRHEQAQSASTRKHSSLSNLRTYKVQKQRNDHAFFPVGRQWRMVALCIVIQLAFWCILVYFTWRYLSLLEVPTFLPYGVQVGNTFITNCSYLPIVFFTNTATLRATARGEEETEDEEQQQQKKSEDATSRTTTPALPAASLNEQGLSLRVLRVFVNQSFDVLMLISIISLIGWLPYFALDIVVIKYGGMSAYDTQYVNLAVGLATGIVFFRFGKPVMKFFIDFKKQQAEKIRQQEEMEQQQVEKHQQQQQHEHARDASFVDEQRSSSFVQIVNPLGGHIEV